MEGICGEDGGVAAGRSQSAEGVIDVVGADRGSIEDGFAFGHLGDAGAGGTRRGTPFRVKGDPLDPATGGLDRNPGEVTAGRSAGGTGKRTLAGFAQAGPVFVVFAEQRLHPHRVKR